MLCSSRRVKLTTLRRFEPAVRRVDDKAQPGDAVLRLDDLRLALVDGQAQARPAASMIAAFQPITGACRR